MEQKKSGLSAGLSGVVYDSAGCVVSCCLAKESKMESEHAIDYEAGWTSDWRLPFLRHGLRYHDSPSFGEMMHVLNATDPHLDRLRIEAAC